MLFLCRDRYGLTARSAPVNLAQIALRISDIPLDTQMVCESCCSSRFGIKAARSSRSRSGCPNSYPERPRTGGPPPSPAMLTTRSASTRSSVWRPSIFRARKLIDPALMVLALLYDGRRRARARERRPTSRESSRSQLVSQHRLHDPPSGVALRHGSRNRGRRVLHRASHRRAEPPKPFLSPRRPPLSGRPRLQPRSVASGWVPCLPRSEPNGCYCLFLRARE